ncbi:MAG: class I SAM-dependent methyltransferase, partial [Planctomycetota bacterium]
EFLEAARERNPGIVLSRADMVDFELEARFDVVTCLFSSIGYAKTLDALRRALASMARHLEPGGLLVLEPWLAPADYHAGRLHALCVDDPELKITRMNLSERRGRLSVLDFHYLVGTPDGIRHFQEHHELGLFEVREYTEAMSRTGLRVHKEEEGLTGRGLFLGQRGP